MTPTWLRLLPPPDIPHPVAATESTYRALHDALTGSEQIELLLVSADGWVGAWLRGDPDVLGPVFRAHLAGAELRDEPPDLPTDFDGTVTEFVLDEPAAWPLRVPHRGEADAPAAVLDILAAADEFSIVQLILRRAPAGFARRGRAVACALATGEPPRSWPDRLVGGLSAVVEQVTTVLVGGRVDGTADRCRGGPSPDQPLVAAKVADAAFAATIRTAAGAGRGRALDAALVAASRSRCNRLVPRPVRRPDRGWADLVAGRPAVRRRQVVLGPAELTVLVHLPSAGRAGSALVRLPGRRHPLPATPTAPGLVLARSLLPPDRAVGVSVDALQRHAYVVGPTGSGKTTLLVRLVLELAAQDVAAVVLDPHGDLTRSLLERLPERALARTRLFDLGDTGNLPTLNPLWLPADADVTARSVRSAAVASVFTDIWRLDRAFTPELLHFLTAAVDLLLYGGDGTLADVARVFTDDEFRRQLLRRCTDRHTLDRWADYARKPAFEKAKTRRSILNKASEFVRNPVLATVFGGDGPGLRLEDTIDAGGLLLVNLPRGLVPEGTVDLLGSLFVTTLHQSVLAREARPVDDRPPVVAVIDEFQEFGLQAFAKVVTSARKYGLGLVVANQNLSRLRQVGADVLSTLRSNVEALAAFRLSAEDAHTLAAELAPFSETDLVALPRFEFAWRSGGPAASARTRSPEPPLRPATAELFARLRVPGRPVVAPTVARSTGGPW